MITFSRLKSLRGGLAGVLNIPMLVLFLNVRFLMLGPAQLPQPGSTDSIFGLDCSSSFFFSSLSINHYIKDILM